jgi:hypothetical protein
MDDHRANELATQLRLLTFGVLVLLTAMLALAGLNAAGRWLLTLWSAH